MHFDHVVAGLEFQPGEESLITVEGFYKQYSDYPFSVNDSVPLSTKAADFGTFGNEEVFSAAEGRAYGLELLYRNRNLFGFNVILSYTLVNSEFKKQNASLEFTGGYLPTAWDNKHLLNLTATRSFNRNWDAGFKWRLVGGAPYTPYDVERSSLVQAWDATGMPYLDYSRFNSLRLGAFHQLDIRIDKEYYSDTWSLRFYVDVQNVYNFKSDEPDRLTNENENGEEIIVNPADPLEEQKYLL